MRQNHDPAGRMDAVHKLFHAGRANASGDAVSKKVNRAAFQSEFEAGNDEEICGGNRVTKSDIFLHALIIEDLRMIAYGNEAHAGIAERLSDTFQRCLTV
jgi:hypothetical protein